VALAKEKGVNLVMATDTKIADSFSNDAKTDFCPVNEIPDGWQGLDIGSRIGEIILRGDQGLQKPSCGTGRSVCSSSRTSPWDQKRISNAIVEATKKRSILPGWWGVTRWLASTTSAMAEKVSYVSTGGRCNCWRLIEGKVLPGVKAIRGY